MRRMSKLVKITVTTILTLSMVLGSFTGVFASTSVNPEGRGIGKVVDQEVEAGYYKLVQDNKGWYTKDYFNGTIINPFAWNYSKSKRFDRVWVNAITQEVWQAGTMTSSHSNLMIEEDIFGKNSAHIKVTVSGSDYDFDQATNLSWVSSDTSVVKVKSTSKADSGRESRAVIEQVGPGTATVTMTATINGVTYTKVCNVTSKVNVYYIDVDTTGNISYVAQETYNGNVTQAAAQLTNATVSNVKFKLNGFPQWTYGRIENGQIRAYTNFWNFKKLSTEAEFQNEDIIMGYTISGTAANGTAISQYVEKEITYAEAVAAYWVNPNNRGLNFKFTYDYLVNTNFYDVTFSDHGTDTVVAKIAENGTVLNTDVPAAATYDEITGDGTKVVHTFQGWLLNNSGTPLTAAQVVSTPITSNTTFVASYSDVSYNTVLFNDGDGNGIGTVIEVEKTHTVPSVPTDADKSDSIVDGVKTTYEFNGNWEDEDGVIYTSAEVAVLSITENKTFTACFDETNHYTVIFETEDGTELGKVEYVTSGNAVDSSLVPTVNDTDEASGTNVRTTNVFEGWVDKDTNASVDPSTEIITTNRTFVADVTTTDFYTINFFDEDGTTLLYTREVENGKPLTDVPADPTKADADKTDGKYFFNFDKWVLIPDLEEINFYAPFNYVEQSEEETEETSIFTSIEGPMNVKATYVETRYVVVEFYVQLADGTRVLADTQYVKPGEDAIDPTARLQSENGYTLGAWSGTFTGVEEDTEVTAEVANIAGAVEEGTDTRKPTVAGVTESGATILGDDQVRTGDNTPVVSMSMLLLAATFSIVFVSKKRRKNV